MASDYYGDAYDELYRGENFDDDGAFELRCSLTYDIPSVEIDHLIKKGYIGGMEVGDEIFVPGTEVSIVRTKNLKDGRARRRAFGRR